MTDERVEQPTRERVTALRTPLPPSLGRFTIMLVVVTCAIAGPSFVLSFGEFSSLKNRIAIVGGVLFCYGVLLALSRRDRMAALLCNRAFTRAIWTAVIVRVVTLPFNAIVDIVAGLVSLSLVNVDPMGDFERIRHIELRLFLATVIQGCFGLIAFGFLLLLIYPIHQRGLRKKDRSGLCIGCGYDLRATRDRCPECGMAVPIGHEPEMALYDYNPPPTAEGAGMERG